MLAIVIPYYKLSFFEKTLLSVENQTDKRFNLYIGNDNSPENPLDTIENVLKDTPYQYFEYNTNLGSKNLAQQWDRVIKESKNEEWIMILGDDDILENNVVEAFYQNLNFIKRNNSSLIKFSQVAIDEENNCIRNKTELPKLIDGTEFLEKRLVDSFPNSLSEHIFSRKLYNKKGFNKFPLAWHTDDLAVLEFANHKPIVFIDQAKVNVRISSLSISGQDNSSKDKQHAAYLFFEYLLTNFSKDFSPEFVDFLIQRYREIIWRNGFPLNLNFTKIYLQKKLYLKAAYSIHTKRVLRKIIKNKTK